MNARVRVGAVGYLNARPLVRGLEQGLGAARLELTQLAPAELARRMAAGEVDLGLLPVVELARIEGLEVVPGLGIVTSGPARSVLLVSRRPLDEVASVGLDPESCSSNALVQVLFHRVWRRAPRFEAGPAALDDALVRHDAAVRIGDKALYEPLPDGTRAYDLGQAWTEAMRLPFVFAVWAARPGVVDAELYRLLHRSHRRGVDELDAIAESYAWRGHRDPAIAREYLRHNIRYRLGSAERRGLRAFLEAAAELRLIERAPELKLASRRHTRCDEVAAQIRGME